MERQDIDEHNDDDLGIFLRQSCHGETYLTEAEEDTHMFRLRGQGGYERSK